MERCAECGEPVAGEGFVVQRQVDGQKRKLLICIWCQGSSKVDAMRARSKAQATQLQKIASTAQTGLTSELNVLRMKRRTELRSRESACRKTKRIDGHDAPAGPRRLRRTGNGVHGVRGSRPGADGNATRSVSRRIPGRAPNRRLRAPEPRQGRCLDSEHERGTNSSRPERLRRDIRRPPDRR